MDNMDEKIKLAVLENNEKLDVKYDGKFARKLVETIVFTMIAIITVFMLNAIIKSAFPTQTPSIEISK